MRKKTLVFSLILGWSLANAQNQISVPNNSSSSEVLNAAIQVRPSKRQLAWQSMEYYAFIHFGTNTFLGKEWGDGTANPSVFNPTSLDAHQWVKALKAAGMKGVILTAKHHDGFCLWPTKTTPYNVSASPWRNGQGDVVRELADACHQDGLKLGIYLSPWDRNNPNYGDSPAYNKLFVAQLTELLSNYGELFEVWFDGACGEGPNGKKQEYDWKSYYHVVRHLQPNAVIAVMGPDVRWCGNEAGIGRDPEWSVLPFASNWQKIVSDNSQQKEGTGMFIPKDLMGNDLGSREKLTGASTLVWYPSEVDTSIRPGWFYHSEQDNQVKTPEKLEQIYYSSIGMNASLLLNIPVDKRGLIHENDIRSLMLFKERIDKTFKQNLLAAGQCKAVSGISNNELPRIYDQNQQTFWKANTSDSTTMMEISFNKPITFNRLLLQENIRNGQKVEKFTLETFTDNQWKAVAEGKTIGYKRILQFGTQSTEKIRIRFNQSRACAEITEIGLYNAE